MGWWHMQHACHPPVLGLVVWSYDHGRLHLHPVAMAALQGATRVRAACSHLVRVLEAGQNRHPAGRGRDECVHTPAMGFPAHLGLGSHPKVSTASRASISSLQHSNTGAGGCWWPMYVVGFMPMEHSWPSLSMDSLYRPCVASSTYGWGVVGWRVGGGWLGAHTCSGMAALPSALSCCSVGCTLMALVTTGCWENLWIHSSCLVCCSAIAGACIYPPSLDASHASTLFTAMGGGI